MMHMIEKEQIQDAETVNDKHQVTFIAESLRLLASVAACQGDDAVASALYHESLTIAREFDYKWYIASCLEELACVVEAQGQPACAARLWDMAEFLRDSVCVPPPPTEHVACDHTVVALRSHVEGREFTAVRAEGRTLLPEQALAAQGLATIPPPTPTESLPTPQTKTSPTSPAGLTAREVEVLRLVAQGLSDAQVAEQLVISPRTVNWHLTSIYSKLGVSSRSAATRYAIEHHLI